HERSKRGMIHEQGTGESSATSLLFIHFGIGFGDAKRLLSARVHLGKPFFAAGEDFRELTGRIDSRGNEILADLTGSTGGQGGHYKGPVKFGEPVGSQGGVASGGATYMWFGISTSSDPVPLIKKVNEQYRRAIEKASRAKPNGGANGSPPIRSETNSTARSRS